MAPPVSTSSQPRKLALYVLPDKSPQPGTGHPALAIRRTVKNAKGRYVTSDQIALFGLDWGRGIFLPTRDDLAMEIGRVILDEAGV